MIAGQQYQRQLFFEGNSLFERNNGVTSGGQYIPSQVYGSLISGRRLSHTSLAISGRSTTQILAAAPTGICTVIRKNDLSVIFEITNDIALGASAATAYQNIIDYCGLVRAVGGRVMVCTMIARNDVPAYWTTGQTVNTNIRTNYASFANYLCDLALDPMFDTSTDADNTTNYNADKIHLNTGGWNNIISLLTTAISAVL